MQDSLPATGPTNGPTPSAPPVPEQNRASTSTPHMPQAASPPDMLEKMMLLMQQQQIWITITGALAHNMSVVPPAPPVHPVGNMNVSGLFNRFQHFRPPTFACTYRHKVAKVLA